MELFSHIASRDTLKIGIVLGNRCSFSAVVVDVGVSQIVTAI